MMPFCLEDSEGGNAFWASWPRIDGSGHAHANPGSVGLGALTKGLSHLSVF